MSDADDIDVQIAQLVTEVARYRARENRYRLRAEGDGGGNSLERNARGVAKYQLARATEQRERAEARLRALERQKEESEMRNPDDMGTTDLRELARRCDESAEAFGGVLRKLHAELVTARQRANGRGPSGLLLWSALERCSCQYFEGTVLRSMRGRPRIAGQPTFERQIEMWLPALTTPPTDAAA
jgi:hypothetical protein